MHLLAFGSSFGFPMKSSFTLFDWPTLPRRFASCSFSFGAFHSWLRLSWRRVRKSSLIWGPFSR